jgi:5-methyltetrahydropteroyltriglutamate--homocysteine methyltransferase
MVQAVLMNAYPRIPKQTGECNLRNALNRFDKGKIGAEELGNIFQDTIKRVIDYQKEADLDIVTDGLIRWDDPLVNFSNGVENLERGGLRRYFDTNTYYRRSIVQGELRLQKSSLVDEYKFAKAYSDRPVKVIMPGPYTFTEMLEDKFYLQTDSLIESLNEILKEELSLLKDAGCQIVQFEEPMLLGNPNHADYAAEWFNKLVRDSGMEIWLSFYFSGVAKIVDKLKGFNADVIAADVASDPRDFDALLSLSAEKTICYGILDARNIMLEKTSKILEQMNVIANSRGSDSFYISTSASMEFLPPQEAYDKLQLLGRLKKSFNKGDTDA